jgi:hypothetical protein
MSGIFHTHVLAKKKEIQAYKLSTTILNTEVTSRGLKVIYVMMPLKSYF